MMKKNKCWEIVQEINLKKKVILKTTWIKLKDKTGKKIRTEALEWMFDQIVEEMKKDIFCECPHKHEEEVEKKNHNFNN